MRRPVRRALLVAVAAASVWHVTVGARSAMRFTQRLPVTWLDDPEVPPNAIRASIRVLPRLAARIPRDARVLLLTSFLQRIQHEFYFLPRPFDRLWHVPAELVETAAEVDPMYAWYGQWLRDRLARRGQLWTPRQYAASVERADYVVTFFFEPAVPGAPQLELIEEREGVRLFRVVRRP